MLRKELHNMDILVWIHIAGLFATGVWLIAVYGKENKKGKGKEASE